MARVVTGHYGRLHNTPQGAPTHSGRCSVGAHIMRPQSGTGNDQKQRSSSLTVGAQLSDGPKTQAERCVFGCRNLCRAVRPYGAGCFPFVRFAAATTPVRQTGIRQQATGQGVTVLPPGTCPSCGASESQWASVRRCICAPDRGLRRSVRTRPGPPWCPRWPGPAGRSAGTDP